MAIPHSEWCDTFLLRLFVSLADTPGTGCQRDAKGVRGARTANERWHLRLFRRGIRHGDAEGGGMAQRFVSLLGQL